MPPTQYPDGNMYIKLGVPHGSRGGVVPPDERRQWMTETGHEADLDALRGLMLRVLPRLRVESWMTKQQY